MDNLLSVTKVLVRQVHVRTFSREMSEKVFLKLLNILPHFEMIKVVRLQRERNWCKEIGNEKAAASNPHNWEVRRGVEEYDPPIRQTLGLVITFS